MIFNWINPIYSIPAVSSGKLAIQAWYLIINKSDTEGH